MFCIYLTKNGKFLRRALYHIYLSNFESFPLPPPPPPPPQKILVLFDLNSMSSKCYDLQSTESTISNIQISFYNNATFDLQNLLQIYYTCMTNLRSNSVSSTVVVMTTHCRSDSQAQKSQKDLNSLSVICKM